MPRSRGDTELETAGAEPDRLAEYRRKRDPTRTVEPFGSERPTADAGTWAGRFVVHHHAATRHHFDLRLQVGAALESFAVPKGPSLDPEQKRLAVHTEPHPLEYLDFEEVIPAGNYGAGPMIVWDTGTVRYRETAAEDGLAAGKLDFDLFGHKLTGRFALIATGRRDPARRAAQEWLLVKKPDVASRPGSDVTSEAPRSVLSKLSVDDLPRRATIAEELERAAAAAGAHAMAEPGRLEPMLCATEPVALDDPRFLYELKLDGVRVIADKDGPEVVLRYRRGRVCTGSYPEIARAVRALAPERLTLDGEMVAFDLTGRPSFQRLARRVHAQSTGALRSARLEVPVVFVAFDLLRVGALWLLDVPLHARKTLLERLLAGPGPVRSLDHFDGDGRPLHALVVEHELEGLIAKRRGSRYSPGERSTAWVKVKREQDDDLVVVGYVTGKGARASLGALDVATYVEDELVYRGKVGSGFTDADVAALRRALGELETKRRPYRDPPPPDPGQRRYVRPELVVSVRHAGWSDEGRLRFPVFRGLRVDVSPTACRAMPSDERDELVTARPSLEPDLALGGAVTNPNKVFWPTDGYTKRDLVAYYAAIAPALLPFLRGRPTLLVRYPDGIEGKSFFQWNPPAGARQHVRVLELRDGEGEVKRAFLIDDLAALTYVANLGSIVLHVLAMRETAPERCDFLTIDFDLNGQPLRDAIVLATTLRGILDEVGLTGYPKTSGQTGLHVIVPLGAGATFDFAKLLAELLGRLIVARHPELATLERVVAKRGARVYVDTGQTGRSRAIVAPYSVRAVPGATVSTPLDWSEVHLALDPRAYTLRTVPDRVAERGDPLAALGAASPDLAGALARLEPLLR